MELLNVDFAKTETQPAHTNGTPSAHVQASSADRIQALSKPWRDVPLAMPSDANVLGRVSR